MATGSLAPVDVRRIAADQHRAFNAGRPSVSFLQTPAWGEVKREWRAESLGWFDGDELVGAGLVLHRQLPRLRRTLAYLPEGPVLDWDSPDLGQFLTPMVSYLRAEGAFGVRMGPPVVTRRWSAEGVKAGIADDSVRRLDDVAPSHRSPTGARVTTTLTELGWRRQGGDEGFAVGQPAHNFHLPLRDESGAARTEADVLRGMNQLWRRNIKKADKSGVVVVRGTAADLPAFHALYAHTAERDGFTPRPLPYFEVMWRALSAEDPDRITLWLAHHEGDLIAATIGIRVGEHVWYSYGASSSDKREVRGSNAVQWAMIRDAIAAGAAVYDLRGITPTLASDDPHLGLIQFKVGTGGEVVEYAGEWDLAIRPLLYRAFETYLRVRR